MKHERSFLTQKRFQAKHTTGPPQEQHHEEAHVLNTITIPASSDAGGWRSAGILEELCESVAGHCDLFVRKSQYAIHEKETVIRARAKGSSEVWKRARQEPLLPPPFFVLPDTIHSVPSLNRRALRSSAPQNNRAAWDERSYGT